MPALAVDLPQLGSDLGLGGSTRGQIDEVVLLGVEGLEFSGELLVQEPCSLLLVGDGLVDVGADLGDEARTESNACIVCLHRLLDERCADVCRCAGTIAATSTEEVDVLVTAGIDDWLHGQALGDPSLLAVSAEHRTLEVVVVDAAAFAGDGPGVEDVLDAVEELLVDERLVAPLDLLVLVEDIPNVVAVAQEVRQLAYRELLASRCLMVLR